MWQRITRFQSRISLALCPASCSNELVLSRCHFNCVVSQACKPDERTRNTIIQGLFRRLTTACEVSEALKLRPEQRDLYRILGIEQESFDVDQKRLEQKYKKLQTVYHPDRYANTSREEQAFSAEASSLVNTAYSTLKAPLDRATYLLARQGFGIDEETESVDDPAFLMEVMEAQEAVNDSDEPEVLQSMKVKYLRRQSDIIQAVSDAFARGDLSSANEGKIHLRYVIRILGAIEEKEEPAWSS